MEPKFVKTFIQVMKEQLAQDNLIHLEGLGKFQKTHQTHSQKKLDDGRVMLMPPKDIIEFKPEISPVNDNQ